jgi:hypothetical protein
MSPDRALLYDADSAYPDFMPQSQPARKAPRRKVVKPKVAKAKRAAVVKKAASRVKSTEKAYTR